MRSSSAVAIAGALLAFWIGVAAAGSDAGTTPAKPPPAAKPTPQEKAREDCLARCRQRNRHTDCADKDGHMMPCPCHCPSSPCQPG